MSGKMYGPPAGESWVWLTRELMQSDAWRSQGINCRRFVDFLLREHLAHGGKENGKLLAPDHQLRTLGIGAQYITKAIREAEDLGIVDCERGGMRVATKYTLTWLPLHDGTAASNRWRAYRNQKLVPLPVPKSRNLPNKGKVALPNKRKADGANLPNKGKADTPKILPNEGKVLSRSSYQDGFDSLCTVKPSAALADGEHRADLVRLSRPVTELLERSSEFSSRPSSTHLRE
jgi:hypothetical protein